MPFMQICHCYTCKGQDGLRQLLAQTACSTAHGQHASGRLGALRRLQWATRSQTGAFARTTVNSDAAHITGQLDGMDHISKVELTCMQQCK